MAYTRQNLDTDLTNLKINYDRTNDFDLQIGYLSEFFQINDIIRNYLDTNEKDRVYFLEHTQFDFDHYYDNLQCSLYKEHEQRVVEISRFFRAELEYFASLKEFNEKHLNSIKENKLMFKSRNRIKELNGNFKRIREIFIMNLPYDSNYTGEKEHKCFWKRKEKLKRHFTDPILKSYNCPHPELKIYYLKRLLIEYKYYCNYPCILWTTLSPYFGKEEFDLVEKEITYLQGKYILPNSKAKNIVIPNLSEIYHNTDNKALWKIDLKYLKKCFLLLKKKYLQTSFYDKDDYILSACFQHELLESTTRKDIKKIIWLGNNIKLARFVNMISFEIDSDFYVPSRWVVDHFLLKNNNNIDEEYIRQTLINQAKDCKISFKIKDLTQQIFNKYMQD